ncbi:unnamed protein product [Mytilus coruscus]|uniref:Uncharacterized protein n=1 Tax=Mytilus coruscus TaxID=42192 RepID=A0A6J8CAM7_MYTCO|nr:unnamed protein product [Mytilus coruscus]
MDQNPLNSSAHVPVKAKTNLIVKGKSKMISTTSKKKTILKWEETNIENNQQKVNQVRKKTEMQNETDVERQAINIIDILQEATELSVVKKIVALKGPKVESLAKSKGMYRKEQKAFYAWKQKDRPKNEENTEYQEMKKHKRELRKQIRKEDHIDKQNFYNKLMDKPDSKTFHRLIRRNKHEPKDANSKVIKNENEEEVMNPEEQSSIFADYYEKLAVPSNEEHYEEDYLEESKYILELMDNITKHQIDTCNITIFSEEEIIKAVNKLNSGKTTDEYSLTAEHFIYTGRSISQQTNTHSQQNISYIQKHKPADEYSLTAEHFIYAGRSISQQTNTHSQQNISYMQVEA